MHITSLTHDLLLLLFGCHLTLYAAIATYKVATSYLPMLDNFKFRIKKRWKIEELDVKTSKSSNNNNNNKLDDSELRNYWNKTKEYMTTQLRNVRDNVPILDVAKNESKSSKAKTI